MKEHEKRPTIESQEDLEAYIEATSSASSPILDVEEEQVSEEAVALDEPPSLEEESPKGESLEEMIKGRRLRVLHIDQEIYELEIERQRLWDEFTESRITLRHNHIKGWLESIENLEDRKRIRDGN